MLKSGEPKNMERAGPVIAKLRGLSGLPAEELALNAWPAAVGKRLAARARAVSLVRTSLIVEVEDAVWQQQLFQLRGPILQKLREVLGAEIVTGVEFRIGSPRRPPQRASAISPNEDGIVDPVFRLVYAQSKRKAAK